MFFADKKSYSRLPEKAKTFVKGRKNFIFAIIEILNSVPLSENKRNLKVL